MGIQFGQNHCYEIKGGTRQSRYQKATEIAHEKATEIARSQGLDELDMMISKRPIFEVQRDFEIKGENGQAIYYAQFATSNDDQIFSPEELDALRAEAKRQGPDHIIDLDA